MSDDTSDNPVIELLMIHNTYLQRQNYYWWNTFQYWTHDIWVKPGLCSTSACLHRLTGPWTVVNEPLLVLLPVSHIPLIGIWNPLWGYHSDMVRNHCKDFIQNPLHLDACLIGTPGTVSVRGHLSISLLPLSSPTSPCPYVFPILTSVPSPRIIPIADDFQARRSDNFPKVDSPVVVDFPTPTPLVPQPHRTNLGHIGTGPCDTTAPSAITWTPIFGRLDTRRLGTAFLCILL
jgi:hypothetical protein